MNYFLQSTLISAYLTQHSFVFRNSASIKVGEMTAYTFIVTGQEQYPSEHLHEAGITDLWLIQDELDEYLSRRNGIYVWVDSIKKSDASVQLTPLVYAAISANMSELGHPNEILVFPYPQGIVDNTDLAQIKLQAHYKKSLNAHLITPQLMAIVPST